MEIKDLCFRYEGGDEVLKDICLSFDNRSTAIIGQNGAGKTTFVKLLKGLLKPTSGDVFINGINTKATSVAALARQIGLVFQNPNDQIFKNKVIDEVLFGPLNIGQTPSEAYENALSALTLVGLEAKTQANPYDLSLSERKLLSIASILAMNTDILIFDEPTIAQDHAGKERIKGLIRNLKTEGKTVVTIIHDMDFVAETFERVLVFAEGRVIMDDATREVYRHKEILEASYLEQPHVTQLCHRLGVAETCLTVEEFIDHKTKINNEI